MVPARTMMKLLGAALATVLATVACQPAQPPAPSAQDALDEAAYQMQQQAWRAGRLADLTKPDGWASLVGFHWLDAGTHRVGSGVDTGIHTQGWSRQRAMLLTVTHLHEHLGQMIAYARSNNIAPPWSRSTN